MTVKMHVYDALDRVEAEQEHVTDKLAALDRFESGVRGLSSVRPKSATVGAVTDGGAASVSSAFHRGSVHTGRTQQVRDLFAETVRPHSTEDVDEPEPVLETIRAEFGDDIALMLSPTTDGCFTSSVKEAVLESTAHRRTELYTMDRALDVEATSLRAAADELETITDRLVDLNKSSLLNLDFDSLRERHETLARHRDHGDRIARDRQEILHTTTSHDATVGITQQSLAVYLYQEFPTSYPVLSTVARLVAMCQDGQRTVRDHLTRRA